MAAMGSLDDRRRARAASNPLDTPEMRGVSVAPIAAGVLVGVGVATASLVVTIGGDAGFEGWLAVLVVLSALAGLASRLLLSSRQRRGLAIGVGIGVMATFLLPELLRGARLDASTFWQAPSAGLVAGVAAYVGALPGLWTAAASGEEPEDRAFAPPGVRRRFFRRRRRADPPAPLPPPPPPAAGT